MRLPLVSPRILTFQRHMENQVFVASVPRLRYRLPFGQLPKSPHFCTGPLLPLTVYISLSFLQQQQYIRGTKSDTPCFLSLCGTKYAEGSSFPRNASHVRKCIHQANMHYAKLRITQHAGSRRVTQGNRVAYCVPFPLRLCPTWTHSFTFVPFLLPFVKFYIETILV